MDDGEDLADHAADPSSDVIDYNTLLGQTESLFASDEVVGDLEPIARDGATSTDDGDGSSDHGVASSTVFVSSILGALDVGGKDTAEPEFEQTSDQGPDDNPDEEIAFID